MDEEITKINKPTTAVKRVAPKWWTSICNPIKLSNLFFVALFDSCYGLLFPLIPSDSKTCIKLDKPSNLSSTRMVSFGRNINLEVIKRIKNRLKATVNDVLFAALTGGG